MSSRNKNKNMASRNKNKNMPSRNKNKNVPSRNKNNMPQYENSNKIIKINSNQFKLAAIKLAIFTADNNVKKNTLEYPSYNERSHNKVTKIVLLYTLSQYIKYIYIYIKELFPKLLYYAFFLTIFSTVKIANLIAANLNQLELILLILLELLYTYSLYICI